jgi:two-component system, NarL family, nitrate/nitrite sensor histidine kinase NarX
VPQRQLRIVHPDPGAVRQGVDALRDSPALRGLLARSLRAIVALTGARGGAVRMLLAGDRAMRLMAAEGLSEEWLTREQHVSTDCGMCGMALRDDCLQLEAESAICARRSVPFAANAAHGPAIAVPLHCRGQAVGVFNLFFGPEARLPADPSTLVAPVSEMLEIALDNAFMEHERLRSSLVAERQMLAGEVHDSLAQGLAFMRMRMTLLHDALESGERQRGLKYFDEVNRELGESHARLRTLITHFRQTMERDLLEALRTTARDFEERTGVALRIDNRAAELRLSPEHQAEVYQIVQEALANVIKHAGARNVRVLIERTPRRLQVMVEDDGRGLADAAGAAGGHYGIEIMRERAQRIGGNLDIRSVARKGTRVRLVVPAPCIAKAGR